MQTYKLDGISSKPKTSKSGKEYISVGLNIQGEWYNGFGKQGVTDSWEKGMEITGIELVTTPEGYKNWKFISIESRLEALEQQVQTLNDFIMVGGAKKIEVDGPSESVTDDLFEGDPDGQDLPF